MPNTCPFPDCGKNVDIIEPFPNTNEESPISALSNRMSESFILSLPVLRMEGIENTEFQQARSYLRCAKCSEDLSSCLPPIGFLQIPLKLSLKLPETSSILNLQAYCALPLHRQFTQTVSYLSTN